jgi:N-acetylated-alpha-linked acidic dipeptidase
LNIFRAEQLAAKASIDVQFEPLRNSIEALQKASIALDEEKVKAQEDLRKLVKVWKKRHAKYRNLKRKIKKALCRIKKALGRKCTRRHTHTNVMDTIADSVIDDATAFGMLMHEDGDGSLNMESFNKHHHKFPIKKLKKVIKRIQAVNQKTAAIEKGFISEEGIKDREWFRHLGVAPGKWLGPSNFND